MENVNWSDWIEWVATATSECPVPGGSACEVVMACGRRSTKHLLAENWCWKCVGDATITSYRYELPANPTLHSQRYEDHKAASLQILCTLLASRGTATDEQLTTQAVDIADQWLGKLERYV